MSKIKLKGIYIAECRDKYGNWKWQTEGRNVVTDTGITHILGRSLTTGVSEIADWYLGLINTSATNVASTHTMGSLSGWTESTLYSESTRPEWIKTLSGQTVGNTGDKATYTIDADGTTIGGAFLCSSKPAGGSAGILMSAAAFGSKKVGDSGDKLELSYKIVGSDDTSS